MPCLAPPAPLPAATQASGSLQVADLTLAHIIVRLLEAFSGARLALPVGTGQPGTRSTSAC